MTKKILRHRAVTVDLYGLQESRGRHLLTQIMMSVCGESVVAVNQRHKWQRLWQRMKLQLLSHTANLLSAHQKHDLLEHCVCEISTSVCPSCLLMETIRFSTDPSLVPCLILMSMTSEKSQYTCSSWHTDRQTHLSSWSSVTSPDTELLSKTF